MHKCCYLGCILTSDAKADEDINSRIAKASAAFGRLRNLLWDEHGIRLDTKINVYVAVVLTILYGCETWTLYRHNIRKLEFHMRCLRRIAHIQWKDKVPNTKVLQICNFTGIEAMLMTAEYRWVGHVTRMDDTRFPKIIFYSELEHGTSSRGGQLKRYKDMLKMNMRLCNMQPIRSSSTSRQTARSSRRTLFKEQESVFERRRIQSLQDKRVQRDDVIQHCLCEITLFY